MNPKNQFLAINIVSFDRVYHFRISKKTLFIGLGVFAVFVAIMTLLAVINTSKVVIKDAALERIGSALDEAKALNSEVIETSQDQIKQVTISTEQRVRQISGEKQSLESLVVEQADTIEKQRVTNDELRDELKRYKVLFKVPSGKPVNGGIRSAYGMRKHPVYGNYRMHRGIDYKAKRGTSIRTTAEGKVKFVGWRSGYGKTVEIDHGYGFSTLYAHLSQYKVREGQYVPKGKVVAKSGNTGVSTGPHLHYEIKFKGNSTNPRPFTQWGVKNYESIKKRFKKLNWTRVERDAEKTIEKYALVGADLSDSETTH